jgi:hypothetical protein
MTWPITTLWNRPNAPSHPSFFILPRAGALTECSLRARGILTGEEFTGAANGPEFRGHAIAISRAGDRRGWERLKRP